jgi:hypothetical protein
MASIVAAFRDKNQQSMYLGVFGITARKPAWLLGVTQKCAQKVSKSGKAVAGDFVENGGHAWRRYLLMV